MKTSGLAYLLVSIAIFASTGLATDAEPLESKRMAWGVPDLQGTWTNATVTGLVRFDDVDELVLTEEVAREIEQGTAGFMASYDNVPEGELEAGDDVGGYNTFWMDPGTRLARVDGEIRSSLIVEPEDGELPYSLRGYYRIAKRLWGLRNFDNPETRLLGERCLVGFGSTGGPPMLPVLYNNNYQIVQSPGFVLILVEMNHDARIIRIDAEPLPEAIRPWFGDSIGHWEGDTLVVETSQFNYKQSFRASLRHFIYLSPDAKVIERFTRVGPKEILYTFEVDDPTTFSQVWRAEIPMLASDGQIYEYACHEGNYSLSGMLSAERSED